MRLNFTVGVILFACLGFNCKKTTKSAGVLVYDFSWTTNNGGPVVNEGITFHCTAPPGSKFLWDFGDGSLSRDTQPYHSYSNAQMYTITLIVNDDHVHAVKKTIDVKDKIHPRYFYYKGVPIVGDTIFFTNNSATDSSFMWDFGDGTSSVDPAPYHIYSVSGVFEIGLKINNIPAQASGSRYLTIYKDSGYARSVIGMRQWRNGKWTKYIGFAPAETKDMPDTVSAIKFIDPVTISLFGYSLTYSPENSTSNILVFSSGHDKLYDYKALYYNIAKDSASSYSAQNGGTKYPDTPFTIVVTYTSP